MAQFVKHGFAAFDVPGFSTIRSWLLRVGHYALTKPLDKLTPWVWLADHTIQIGVQKVLVILGCPLNQVPFGERALQLADLQLVALVPMEKSNGALVKAELKQAAERTGCPRLIVSDQGPDLKKGIADFQDSYACTTAYVPDVAHYGATQLEHAWADEPRWQQFIKELQNTSAKVRQTKSAYLLAPRMRAKARFMNVDVQLRFARRVLKLLLREIPHPKATEYYGWLKDYQDDLAVWEREHSLVKTTIEMVRVDGLHTETGLALEQAWGEIGTRESTVRVADRLREYVTKYQPKEKGERFVASTEILESGFGKFKRIEGQQSQDGVTSLVLTIGAMVGTSTDAELKDALEKTPEKKVDNWVEKVLGKSMQWFRRQFFAETKA